MSPAADPVDLDRRPFDAWLAVDWSARASPAPAHPSRDAPWLGEAFVDPAGAIHEREPAYFRTRGACVAAVEERLAVHRAAGRRVLVGWDLAFGYPRGLAAALGAGSRAPWRHLWDLLAEEITDEATTGANNRFEVAARLNRRLAGHRSPPDRPGPFWGHPPGAGAPRLPPDLAPWLGPRSPGFPHEPPDAPPLERLRTADRRLPGVQEVWKLAYAGSVGSQTLLGIAALHRLRFLSPFATETRVWPFETGFDTATFQGAPVVHAELWPGVIEDHLDPDDPIRDRTQVRTAARWLAENDRSQTLTPLLTGPEDLPPTDRQAAANEEAWILGAP